jgi:hypothetical protein
MRARGRSRRSQGYSAPLVIIVYCRFALCATRRPAAQGRFVCFAYPAFRFAQSGINPRSTHFLKVAQARSETCRATIVRPLTGLGYCGRELAIFLNAVRRGDPTPGGNARVSLFLLRRGDAKREPAGLSRGGPARLFALRCAARWPAAQRRGVCFSLPTLFGFAVLAFRVGSIIPRLAALGQRRNKVATQVRKQTGTRRSGRVSPFSVVQGRRDTEAQIGCGCDWALHSRLCRSFRMTVCSAAILRGAALLARGGPAQGHSNDE